MHNFKLNILFFSFLLPCVSPAEKRLKEVAVEMQASQLKTSEVTAQAEKTSNELPVPLVSSQLN